MKALPAHPLPSNRRAGNAGPRITRDDNDSRLSLGESLGPSICARRTIPDVDVTPPTGSIPFSLPLLHPLSLSLLFFPFPLVPSSSDYRARVRACRARGNKREETEKRRRERREKEKKPKEGRKERKCRGRSTNRSIVRFSLDPTNPTVPPINPFSSSFFPPFCARPLCLFVPLLSI